MTTIERGSTTVILELDPGVSKRGLTKNMPIYMDGKFKQQPREPSLKRLIMLKQMRNINSKQKFVAGGDFITTGKRITPI